MSATTTRTIHAFCSAKGGVGKSTLAVTCAKLLAGEGRTCVLIDADLTGTSLADGLRLCAPKVVLREDGSSNLDTPPDGFTDRAKTLELRASRDRTDWVIAPPPPPFLNDALIHGHAEADEHSGTAQECRVASFLWKHEVDDGVLYLPSSPLRRDVAIALGWLYYEQQHAWIRRMTWLIEGMREQMPKLSDVVLDLPPGLFGFADEVLTLLSHLDTEKELPEGYPPTWNTVEGRWRARPFLVTTQDRNDLASSIPYFLMRRADLPSLVPLINRRTESIESIVGDLRERFSILVDSEMLRPIDELRESLGLVFTRGGDLPRTTTVESLRGVLGLLGEGPGT